MEEKEGRVSNEEAMKCGALVSDFKALPERVKDILLLYMFCYSSSIRGALLEALECESPIEQMLSAALSLVVWDRCGSFGNCLFDTYPQFEVEANGNKYRADFYFYAWNTYTHKELSLVVECDGHDFHHATKEQVKRDNEREYDLKVAGMDVLRFSGTQIYNAPCKCANDILDYIKMKLEPGEE